MRKFKRVAILDMIMLSAEQWNRLYEMAEEVIIYGTVAVRDALARLEQEMGMDPGYVCWTQLAQEKVTDDELSRRLAGCDAVISCWTNISDEVLRANPQIKYIGFWTNLVNHRINLELAKEMGIEVTYIPDYGTIAVAEYTFALMFELERRVAYQHKETLRGSWPYENLKNAVAVDALEGIPYHNLHDQILGVIGMGRIGQHVTKIALAFGMRVIYYSRNRRPELEAMGAEYRELDDLLPEADIVTLHLSPYAYLDPKGRVSIDDHAPDCPESSPETKDEPVISRERLALLRDGAIFINTSAGRLVDEDALLMEVEAGRIRVAIDVYRSNPDRKKLQKVNARVGSRGKKDLENVFTYRGGWYSQEAILAKGESLLGQMSEFLQKLLELLK